MARLLCIVGVTWSEGLWRTPGPLYDYGVREACCYLASLDSTTVPLLSLLCVKLLPWASLGVHVV